MKKFIALIFGILFLSISCNLAWAANTYYVRTDGGTATQCTGLADAPYPGTGTSVACSFNHPNWALAIQGNNPSKLVGGDTLIIDGSNSAKYQIGLGSPNIVDTKCGPSWPWDCYLRPVPSGPDSLHPTRILGKGWDTGCTNPPQFWGTDQVSRVLNLIGSNNVEVQCLEITDHSACMYRGPTPTCNESTFPRGPYAVVGIESWDSSNVLLNNVNVHGLREGVHAGRLKDWTIKNTKIVNNSFAGWDADVGGVGDGSNSANSGTLTFDTVTIKYAGCGETYPGLAPYNCYSQDQGGYGDGLGFGFTGANLNFINCDISNNVSDGLDALYHNLPGLITIKGGKYDNNAGNQIKIRGNGIIADTETTGNCAYFKNNILALQTWNGYGFNNCRARGNAISLAIDTGTQVKITNTKFNTVIGDTAIMTTGGALTCNGTEIVSVDTATTFDLQTRFYDPTSLASKYYAAGADGNSSGTCGQLKLTTVSGTTCTPILNSCNAPTPACSQTTSGVDNCGTPCAKQGAVCSCISDGSCNASQPPCGGSTTGTDNCGQPCTRQGIACTAPTCTYQWCDAALPTTAGQKVQGKTNCGEICWKVGVAISSPVCPTCQICPAPTTCIAPTLNGVTVNLNSNGTTYTLTK